MPEYEKRHLNYAEQVDLLRSRGLAIADEGVAVRALKRIGYYRLSAYTYPLRAQNHGEGSRRSDGFVDGATFEDAVTLCDFDDRLRSVLLDGLQQLEVGLRVQIAYELGKLSAFGHLDRQYLDEKRCSERPRPGSADADLGLDAHASWLRRYQRLQAEAKNEDFVKHFVLNYGARIPIGVATEFLTFGSVTRLYSLLKDREATRIARHLGVPQRDIVHGWLRSLNALRNDCAHNARIWNRATIYPPKRLSEPFSPALLTHLSGGDNTRVYYLAALCAFFLLQIAPDSRWPGQFRTVMRKFSVVNGMTPENTMGFPEAWDDLDLWKPRT
ncbi:MAG: Abi family protein [Promicromonosporaceae bacterium]|nr:Abi family protein [Promicromonosporaceae bacterium]